MKRASFASCGGTLFPPCRLFPCINSALKLRVMWAACIELCLVYCLDLIKSMRIIIALYFRGWRMRRSLIFTLGTTTESSSSIHRNLRSKRGYPVYVYEPAYFPLLFGIEKLTSKTTTTVTPKKFGNYYYSSGKLDHNGGSNLLWEKVRIIDKFTEKNNDDWFWWNNYFGYSLISENWLVKEKQKPPPW